MSPPGFTPPVPKSTPAPKTFAATPRISGAEGSAAATLVNPGRVSSSGQAVGVGPVVTLPGEPEVPGRRANRRESAAQFRTISESAAHSRTRTGHWIVQDRTGDCGLPGGTTRNVFGGVVPVRAVPCIEIAIDCGYGIRIAINCVISPRSHRRSRPEQWQPHMIATCR